MGNCIRLPEIADLLQKMFDDQDLGFFANFLGIFIFVLVIAYHYVMADPKYEGN
ncbi:Dolichyl-diphosphooligosaccharide--protein glycosyltransferase [Salix suchowensis]|nr:Dolichyl-diphosphooligosaccharide--protein glycosyltransferase [Salix suchowensis]